MARRLRHFTYLDSRMAESYLSSLVGGLPEGGSSTERANINERGEWGIGLRRTGIGGGRATDSASEDQETFKYNPEGIFSLLYKELEKEEDGEQLLLPLQDMDEEAWGELRKGDILELTGTIRIPDMLKAIEAANKLNELLPFLDLVGGQMEEEIDIDENQRSMIRGIGSLQEATESQDATVIIVELANAPGYRFVGKLKTSNLRTAPADLEGEATILATVNRKLRKGDPPIGIEQLIPGMEAMMGMSGSGTQPNRATRRAKPKKQESKGDASIGYPSATINTIAIY